MTVTATCPTDPAHARFITTVHVTEDWIVDRQGNWIETAEASGEVSFGPDPGNIWTCADCGAQAEV
jgi:hypothetical protein